MTRNPTTTFRFDEPFLQGLETMANRHGVSRAEVVRQAVAALAGSFEVARNDALNDLGNLRTRYGDDAQLIVSLSAGADGHPEARVVIDGTAPDDVRAFPVLAEGMNEVHVFLDVKHEDRAPLLVRVGSEALLIPRARMPIGELPWPPDPTRGIVIRLGDLDLILDAQAAIARRDKEPVEA
jgi:hypothetical protein